MFPFKDLSHYESLTKLNLVVRVTWVTWFSIALGYHGNPVLAHCLLTTKVVGCSVDSLVADTH